MQALWLAEEALLTPEDKAARASRTPRTAYEALEAMQAEVARAKLARDEAAAKAKELARADDGWRGMLSNLWEKK